MVIRQRKELMVYKNFQEYKNFEKFERKKLR